MANNFKLPAKRAAMLNRGEAFLFTDLPKGIYKMMKPREEKYTNAKGEEVTYYILNIESEDSKVKYSVADFNLDAFILDKDKETSILTELDLTQDLIFEDEFEIMDVIQDGETKLHFLSAHKGYVKTRKKMEDAKNAKDWATRDALIATVRKTNLINEKKDKDRYQRKVVVKSNIFVIAS